MKLHLYRHSIQGAFESLHGQVKSYSIYHPYIYEYSKTWPTEFLENRSIMEEFLLSKHPILAEVPLQTYELPSKYRFKSISALHKVLLKLKALSMFVIRGLSIDYNSWWKSKEVKKLIEKTFQEDNIKFDELFKKEDIKKMLKYKRYDALIENLIKIKLMLDIVEKQEYHKLLDLNLGLSSKY